jgi:hypothetical protein
MGIFALFVAMCCGLQWVWFDKNVTPKRLRSGR